MDRSATRVRYTSGVRWTVPASVEDALRRAAESVLGGARVGGPALTHAVVDRSRRYTSERALLAVPTDPDGDLAARACFFSVADSAKPRVALAELAAGGALPAADPLRVVDLGAGCGAMSIGLALELPERAMELVLVDHDDRALAIAARALAELAPNAKVRAVTGDVATAIVPRCDLVLIGSTLNELAPAAARGLLERAVAAIRDDGAVIVIEPALRDTTRALHALRDPLVAGGAHVYAPCGHDLAPCPMLANERDWCHEERGVELPPRTRQLAATTGLRDGAMKFSYLTLRRAPGAIARGTLRVVDAPRAQKGKHELVTCDPTGLRHLRLLSRHKSDANRAFLHAVRGDLLTIDPLPTSDLAASSTVRVQGSSSPPPSSGGTAPEPEAAEPEPEPMPRPAE
jgi:ribosomal protein RSM22 (predicted rRNA methylase)